MNWEKKIKSRENVGQCIKLCTCTVSWKEIEVTQKGIQGWKGRLIYLVEEKVKDKGEEKIH